MPTFLIFLALVLALTAVTLLILARRARAQTGLPAGRVVYNDAGPVLVPEKPFYDATLGLTGKPDYLVDTGGGVLVPVEVKSGWAPPEPREGHVLQALAYCALV
jgi:CRISPR-associated exonuclease Cas4